MKGKIRMFLRRVLTLVIVFFQLSATQVTERCNSNADIAFLVDSSGSISRENYEKVKTFVSNLAASFNISPGGSRVAVVLYSTGATTAIKFDDFTSADSFERAVKLLKHERGFTRIDLALQRAYYDLFGRRGSSRYEVPKIAFLLTDGKQTEDSQALSLGKMARLIKDQGVRIVAIGVGKQVETQELMTIATNEKDVIQADTFDDLLEKVQPIAESACESFLAVPIPEEIDDECQPDVDVAFLVDSSGSISFRNFRKVKNFVVELASKFDISPGGSRAAVVVYSTRATTRIRFTDHSTYGSFANAVQSLRHERGYTRIDLALEKAYIDVFGPRGKPRFLVPKIAFVLTDGEQTRAGNELSLEAVSDRLKKKAGVRIISIGIGKRVHKNQLTVIASSEKDVVIAESFDGLVSEVEPLFQSACKGIEELPRCGIQVDIAFLVDSSGSISSTNYRREKAFINAVAKSFGISKDKSRAALVLFSNSASTKIRFEDHSSTASFTAAVEALPHERGFTRIDRALEVATREVFPNARKGVYQIAMVITDGKQTQMDDTKDLREVSKPLRKAGVRVLALGVGSRVDEKELRLIVERDGDVLLAKSFTELISRVGALIESTCNLAVPEPCDISADLTFIFGSGGIGAGNFLRLKTVLKTIATSFGISSKRSRASIVTFSDSSASVSASFESFTSTKAFQDSLSSLTYKDKRGDIRLALKLAEKRVFPKARKGVAKIAVVVIDGRENNNGQWQDSVLSLRKAGIRVLLLGIGTEIKRESLRKLVEKDDDLVIKDSFITLLKDSVQVAKTTCSAAGATVPRDFQADILFLVDSSQTISKRKFLQELEFVKAFARKFDVSSEKSRVGVITFGNTPILSIRFEDYGNILSFSEGVNRVPYQGGQKSLNNALVFAARVLDLSKTRPKADKILVLLTDGQQPLSYDPKEGSVEALRQLGVHINVIGAGGNVSMQELRKLTLSPDDLFYSRTFDALILQAPIVFKRTMNVVLSHHQLQHGVFLLESSLFRTRGEFESQINFVKSIAKRLQVSPTGTRAGVILYGDEPKLSIGLNDYSTLPELYNLLDNLAHESGGRQLHKALTLAGETLQKSPQEIPKFVVVILEGQQYSSGSLLLRDAVKPLQALGVTIYVVGIGEKLNRQELYTMVQTSRYIIQVPRFTELLRQMEFIAYRIETTITDPCHETLDVGFVIDASGSVGMDTFSREKNFVKLVSRRFAATSPNTRLGLLVFSDTPKLFVDFADYESKTIEQFQANVAQATFQDGRSRIDLALRAASQDFFTNRRSGVPRVLILVSDGRQSEDPGYYPLATAVKPLQAQRVRIVGVGFGDSVDVENLKEITGSKDRILLDQEINDIDRLQMELVSKACEV